MTKKSNGAAATATEKVAALVAPLVNSAPVFDMLFKVKSVIKYYTNNFDKIVRIGKEELSSICMLEVILNSTLPLDKISVTLVFILSFKLKKITSHPML